MTSYAQYVGRIGALAVALGVGVVVASSPGVAWAGPDADGGNSSGKSASQSDGQSSTGAPRYSKKEPKIGAHRSDDGLTSSKESSTPATGLRHPRARTLSLSGGDHATLGAPTASFTKGDSAPLSTLTTPHLGVTGTAPTANQHVLQLQ